MCSFKLQTIFQYFKTFLSFNLHSFPPNRAIQINSVSLFAYGIIDFPMSLSTSDVFFIPAMFAFSHQSLNSLSSPIFHLIPAWYSLVPFHFSGPKTISVKVEPFVEKTNESHSSLWFATCFKDCICPESHHSQLFQCIYTAYTFTQPLKMFKFLISPFPTSQSKRFTSRGLVVLILTLLFHTCPATRSLVLGYSGNEDVL